MKLFFGYISLFTTVPMWYILVYQMLDNIPVEPWVWSIYWAYLPIGIFLAIMNKFFENE